MKMTFEKRIVTRNQKPSIFQRGENLMNNTKVARKLTALLSGVVLSGQFATGAVISAHAESDVVDYSVEQNVSSSWYGGCCAEIVLTNLAGTETEGWKITFSTTDKITNLWNGTITETIAMGDSYQYTVEAANYNGVIAAGQKISIGYIGEGNDHSFADVKAELFYVGKENAESGTETEQAPKTETETEQTPETEIKTELPMVSGTIITGYGLSVTEDNPYYQDLVDSIEELLQVKEVADGNQYTEWTTICPFGNSNSSTDLIVSINMDRNKIPGSFTSEEEMLRGSVYRISGTYRGEKVEHYIAYCDELNSLRGRLEKAKQLQIRMFCETTQDLYGDFMYKMQKDQILVWADELGRITVVTDSAADLPYSGNIRVHITDLQPVDPFATGEYNPNLDISGNVSVVK